MSLDNKRIAGSPFTVNRFPRIKNTGTSPSEKVAEELTFIDDKTASKKQEARYTAAYQAHYFQSNITSKKPDDYNDYEYQYYSVWKLIKEQYYDGTFNNQDWNVWENAFKDKLNSSKDVELAVSIMLSSLGDDYSYMKLKSELTTTSTTTGEKDIYAAILKGNIGYIRIKRMTNKTSYDFTDQLIGLLNKNGLIIDLRDNPGGTQDSAFSISESLLQNDAIEGYKVNKGDYVEEIKTRHAGLPCKGPIIILINSKTASAAEILTAILSENDIAISVGERTFGKNTIQHYSDHPEFFIRYSVAKYLTPSHTDIEGFGIIPDLEVKLSKESLRDKNGPWFHYGTDIKNCDKDIQLNAAIKLLRTLVST